MLSKENDFLAQAHQGKNDWWRYILTVILAFGLMLAAQVGLLAVVVARDRTLELGQFSANTLLVVSMLPFGFLLVGLWAGMHWLHGRSFLSLISPGRRIAWGKLTASALVWLALSALGDLTLALLQPGNYAWTFDAAAYGPFLCLALVLVPIQVSAEEILFRGYLMQGVGLLSKRYWLPWLVPSVLFGLLHSFNSEVNLYGLGVMMLSYLGSGLLLGWITLRNQSLELALGFHLANNLYNVLLVTYPGSAIRSPALFTITQYDALASLAVFLLLAVFYLLVFFRPGKAWLRGMLGAILSIL